MDFPRKGQSGYLIFTVVTAQGHPVRTIERSMRESYWVNRLTYKIRRFLTQKKWSRDPNFDQTFQVQTFVQRPAPLQPEEKAAVKELFTRALGHVITRLKDSAASTTRGSPTP